jgi:ATP-dependent DNA ligase
VLDGELAIPICDSLSFDDLQFWLHPAESRVRKLAAETPPLYILFDILSTPENKSLLAMPLRER